MNRFLTTFILIVSFHSVCKSQWQPSNGPYDGFLTCITETPSGLFVASNGGGIYFSSDHAQSWTCVNNGLTCTNIMCLMSIGDTVYAGTVYGIFKSDNNGSSWNIISPPYMIFSLGYFDNAIYAATYQGLYKSVDLGHNWIFIDLGFGHTSVCDINFINGLLYAGTENNGLLISSDHGFSWSAITNLSGSWVSNIISNGSSLLASTETGIYISYDAGATWSSYMSGLPCPSAYSIMVKDSNYYAGDMQQFLSDSHQQGAVWHSINSFQFHVFTVFFSGDDIYLMTSGGVLKSIDHGQTFTRSNYGLIASQIISITSDASNVYASTLGGGLFKSTDDGLNWTPCNNGLNECSLSKIASNGAYLFAAGINIHRSSDGGNTWIQSSISQNNHEVTDFAFKGNDVYLTTFANGIFKSVDNGQTFFQTNNGMSEMNFYDVEIIDSVILAASYHGLYRSTDNGNSWSFSLGGIPDSSVFNLAVINGIILATTDTGMYKSTDYGLSWTESLIGPNIYKAWLNYSDGQYVYTATDRDGIFMSPDAGNTWIPFDSGLPKSFARCFNAKTNSYRIFLGGDGYNFSGVWYQNMVYNLIPEENTTGITFNVFPQPFDEKLNINYVLEKSSQVTIEVFDESGRKVDQLKNEFQQTGKHNLIWVNKTPGIYLIQISTDEFTSVKKVIKF